MISIFDISPSDQSVYYLGQIFGVVSQGVLAPQSAPMMLGVLFKVFNTSILTLGAGIVIYTTIVGLMKTAQEGEFLGKQWSSLWVPLRTVFGIAALFPLPTGYSSIQVIFMWIIMQGVGAADTVWNTVINYTIIAGSPLGQQDVSRNLNNLGLDNKFQNLFQALVCQAEAARTPVDFKINGISILRYYCGGTDPATNPKVDMSTIPPFCKITTTNDAGSTIAKVPTELPTDKTSTTFSIGPNGYCGKLSYCNESVDCADQNSQKCIVCKNQKKALNLIIPVMASIAEKVAQTDDEYLAEVVYQAKQAIIKNASLAGFAIPSSINNLSTNYQTPSWIADYCSNEEANGNNDCITSGFSVFGGTNRNDLQNASTDLIKKVYWKWSVKPFVKGSQKDLKDFIESSKDLYHSALVAGNESGAATSIINNNGAGAADWQKSAINYGWIFAGGYFYKVVAEGAKTLDSIVPDLAMTGETTGDMSITSTMKLRSNFSAAYDLLQQMSADAKADASSNASSSNSDPVTSTSQATGSTGGLPGQFSAITSSLSSSASAVLSGFVSAMSQCSFTTIAGGKDKKLGARGVHVNPLVPIGNYGRELMMISKIVFITVTAVTFILVAVFTTNPMALGTGLTMGPIGEAIKSVLSLVSPFFIALLVGMYSLGAILGIYLPLIPFMIFTMGAVGWLLATVEAMVAAPIVALGILSPGGQSEILGRAEPAVMLILNLFLRPSLMVIGLMAAVLVSVPVMALVNTAFLGAVYTIINKPDIFEELLLIAFYSSFVVTVISKCYGLTYVIPERVLTWIGGQAVQYGEAEAMQAAKQGVEGGAHGASGAMKESEAGAADKGLRAKSAFNRMGRRGAVPGGQQNNNNDNN